MIKPTVGRVVWYHPSKSDFTELPIAGDRPGITDAQPMAALVAHVWSDTCVNLMVVDANGTTFSRTSVLLVQDENPRPESGAFCEWMPYQKGQAAKTEAAEDRERLARSGVGYKGD